ncbi:hypothetical protein GY45DRAFT_807750 [Cubamyces sp. BRFM 1775]|nr:hypothetical protein GY45DRAFT_807750 [Cubamyces sp. BRFM 1775]
MTAPHLPYELIYRILIETQRGIFGCISDNLHWDKRALASYAFVCSTWRPPAQALLFEGLSLVVGNALDHFLAFLQSAPHIASAIRNLYLRSRWTPEIDDNTFTAGNDGEPLLQHDHEASAEPLLSPAVLMDIVGILPTLSHLHLERITLLGWPEGHPLPTRPVSLRCLNLVGITYMPSIRPGLLSFDIFSFFELDLLNLGGNAFVDGAQQHAPPSDVLAIPGAGLPIVRDVRADGHDCFLERNLRRGGLNADHVHRLSLSFQNVTSEILFVGSLLGHYSRNATHIDLDIHFAHGRDELAEDDAVWQVCSLAACTQLQFLSLSWHIDNFSELDQDRIEAYDAIVGTAPRTLFELKICMSSPRPVSKEMFEPTALILAPRIVRALSRFPCIKDVKLIMSRSFDYDGCKARVHELLPRAVAESPVLKIEKEVPWVRGTIA